MTKWSYTKEEWKNFLHWKTKKRGLLFFLFRKMVPIGSAAVPEITITNDTVWINRSQKSFQDDQRKFRAANIREAENVNILEIHYEQANKIRGINLPIPKGKLREAIVMQERLNEQSPRH